MKLCTPLCAVWCVLFLIGTKPSAPDVQGVSLPLGPVGGSVVRLHMEVEAPEAWNLSLGASAVITCSINREQNQDLSGIRVRLVQTTPGAIQVLSSAASSSGPLSYTLGPITLEDRGLYSCEVDGAPQKQNVSVEPAHRLLWVHDPAPAVTLDLLRVQRVHFFHGKKLIIGCALPEDGAEWKVMSASERTGGVSECPDQERSGNLVSCSVSSRLVPVSKMRQYESFWCQSSTGLKSNVLNLTDTELKERNGRQLMVTKFDLGSPWFVRAGDSVSFMCSVQLDKYNNSEKCDLQLIHTRMRLSRNMTVVLSQHASQPINYTLDSVSHEHQGVWSCYDDGTLPHVFTLPWHHFLWVEDDSARVTISVLSHNRTEFFSNERVTVGCRLPQGEHDHWKLMRFNKWTGALEACPGAQVSGEVLSCSLKTGYPWGDELYWCQSDLGHRSNALNMSTTVTHTVLEAPPLPVMEGDDLTLRCLRKDKVTGAIAAVPAYFAHRRHRYLSRTEEESITVRNVTKANEGLYYCSVSFQFTGDTYITVRARPQEQKEPQGRSRRRRGGAKSLFPK